MQLSSRAKSSVFAWLAVGTTLLAALTAGVLLGIEFSILILAGGALLLVIMLLWSSVQSLTGASPLSFEEALTLGAPSAEEEQKRSILRALKDLEYERSVGKISAEDYAEYSARYRAEAKQLMQALDQDLSGARSRAEALLKKRLSALDRTPGSGSEPPPKPTLKTDGSALRSCRACGVENELDANFCKKCGVPLASDQTLLCGRCPAVYARELEACPACGAPGKESS